MSCTNQPAVLGKHRRYGCEHYMNKCYLVAACCRNKKFKCVRCHDENTPHMLDHASVKLSCKVCLHRQAPEQHCQNCSLQFGRYACNVCLLYDDEDMGQYHCNSCGFCRLGGAHNFFHCFKCDVCLPIAMMEHKCVEQASWSECPLCLEDLHTSRDGIYALSCGHLIHSDCLIRLEEKPDLKLECPLCRAPIQSKDELHLIAPSAI